MAQSTGCDEVDEGIAVDLNYLPNAGLPGTVAPSPGELLIGWDNWNHLLLAVTDGGGSFAGPIPPDVDRDATGAAPLVALTTPITASG